MERPSAWKSYSPEQLEELHYFNEGYKAFISDNKTERECSVTAIRLAKEAGYIRLSDAIAAGQKLKAGDKVYADIRGKSVIFVQLGKQPLQNGLNILGAHIDSPRLDVKQNPLEERSEIATLDTHYYGGVKKYQWVTIPLAIHGVIALKDGSTVTVVIGEDEDDPVFCISDLLIHLSREQLGKKASEAIEGEMLDLIVGNRPLVLVEKNNEVNGSNASAQNITADNACDAENPSAKEAVKASVLALLKDSYGIEEEDFLSAELEIVPAGAARDMGFDRSMVLGYGHDDRSCAYPSLIAQLDAHEVERTAVTVLADKEEIGSRGATGMTSRFFENTIAEILELADEGGSLALRRCLKNSRMLSSDVSAAYDPNFPNSFEIKNSAFMGHGLAFNKYTGSGGKGNSNDADAEYIALIRRIMDDAGIAWQTAELGRVDAGGGGTIAYMLARYGMQVIDCGVPVLSMHAPWEIASKADLYEAYRGYMAFLRHCA